MLERTTEFLKQKNLSRLLPDELQQLAKNNGLKIHITPSSKINLTEIHLIDYTCFSNKPSDYLKGYLTLIQYTLSQHKAIKPWVDHSEFYILIRDQFNMPLGYGRFKVNLTTKNIELLFLAIAYDQHTKGLGKIIIASGIYLTRFLNVNTLDLFPTEEAKGFYEHLKFKPVATKHPYLMKNVGLFSTALTDVIKTFAPKISSLSPPR